MGIQTLCRHATSRDLVTWINHGNQIGTYSGFVLPNENGRVCAGQRCGNVWCGVDGTKVNPSCGDPRQTGCPGLFINGTGAINGTSPDMVPMFLTCATDSTLSKWEGHRKPVLASLTAFHGICMFVYFLPSLIALVLARRLPVQSAGISSNGV